MSSKLLSQLEDFVDQLAEALAGGDLAAVETLIGNLLDQLRSLDATLPAAELEPVLEALELLCNARRPALVEQLADCLLQSGHTAAKIRRLYAQALIDDSLLDAGRNQLRKLMQRKRFAQREAGEHREVRGLLGRIEKQIYLNAKHPAGGRIRGALQRSINNYRQVYDRDPGQLWHGINAVALLILADRRGVQIQGDKDPKNTAREFALDIRRRVERLHRSGRVTVWDYATATEASLARGEIAEAWRWIERFTDHPSVTAFHLASTERQLREVWKLSCGTSAEGRLLQALRAATLDSADGRVDLEPQDLDLGALAGKSNDELEKVFGRDRFSTVSWWLDGLAASKAVARIGRRADEGLGTGFLIAGSDLHPSFGEESLLLTNAHVISDDPGVDALRTDEVVVTFASQNHGRREFHVAEQLWTSPPGRFDATLLRLDPPVDGITPMSLAKNLPSLRRPYRLYVIGHPGGRGLSFSIQDNLLLDHGPMNPADVDHGVVRIHYRTPTEPGSSGSPVFNREWRLIGLHHKGSQQMGKLKQLQPPQDDETYAANEGIGIQSIHAALARDLAG